MRMERRGWLLGLALGAAFVCVWCSFLSAFGGWVVGRDIARREARITYQATVEAGVPTLPELGVLVTRLDRTGPAARAGLERGDLIIAINGAHLQDPRDLREQLLNYGSGDTVRLTVVRGRSDEQIIGVQLEPFPGGGSAPYIGIYYTARADEPADL